MGNHGVTDLKITMKSRNQTFEIVNKVLQSKGGTWAEM